MSARPLLLHPECTVLGEGYGPLSSYGNKVVHCLRNENPLLYEYVAPWCTG